MAALQINNVEKRYQSLQALGGVSLSIEEGEFSACSALTVPAKPH